MSARSNLLLLFLASLCPPALFSQATTQGAAPGKLIYDKQYSADDILNGTMLGRPPVPPPLPVTYDATGFAEDRLFHVPVAGVHPRILFGPGEKIDGAGQKKNCGNHHGGRAHHPFYYDRSLTLPVTVPLPVPVPATG